MAIDNFHPAAAEAFTEKARQLAAQLGPPERAEPPPFAGPLPHVRSSIGPSDIVSVGPLSYTDVAGDEIARSAIVDGTVIGLEGTPYKEFVQLAEQIHGHKSLGSIVLICAVVQSVPDSPKESMAVRQTGYMPSSS